MLDRILAALIFFTRLPFWRIKTLDATHFKHVVDYWPFAGWITGGLAAFSFWFCALFFPPSVAIWIAIGTRLLVTGALHEDGLADFFDAFGGKNTPERTLSIMKDSHIGTYGVVGLIVYYALYYHSLAALPVYAVPFFILLADVYAKSVASYLIQQLPYARRESESKARVIYVQPVGRGAIYHVMRCLLALLPMLLWWYFEPVYFSLWAFVAPIAVELGLAFLMHKRLGGYTGDCCGAVFLLCELSFWLTCVCSVSVTS